MNRTSHLILLYKSSFLFVHNFVPFSDWPRRGYAFYKGPHFLKDIYFAGFEKNPYYKSGAISWQLANIYYTAVYSSFENALFNFDDSVSHTFVLFDRKAGTFM